MYSKINLWVALLFLAIVALPSCLNSDDDNSEPSDDPTLASLTFGENDNIPYLETAVFTIDNENKLVYNVDSLPFGTRIDSVFPVFKFTAQSSGAILYFGSDSLIITNQDTVDFSIQPVRLVNYAEDGISKITYEIHVNVHQVEPELYVWNHNTESIYTGSGSVQKTLWFNNKLYFFASSGINNYLYTSEDGTNWNNQGVITGLPAYNNFQYMVTFNENFYLADNTVLYSSTNGTDWQAADMSSANFEFVNLLFVFDQELWAITQNTIDNKYYFASTKNGADWTIGKELPTDFPINDFAAVSFYSRTNQPKALVMGGYSSDGKTLNTRWTTEDGNYWINFTIEQPKFGSLAGASIVHYDDKLLLFGGVDSNNSLIESHLLETKDEGLNWLTPDTTYNKLPEEYTLRTRQSVVVNNNKRIFVVGGQSTTETLKDVWSCKINKANWE